MRRAAHVVPQSFVKEMQKRKVQGQKQKNGWNEQRNRVVVVVIMVEHSQKDESNCGNVNLK